MGSLCGLALTLFFCCWEAGASRSSAGPHTLRPDSLGTMNHTEVTAVTLGVNTSSEGNAQAPDLIETPVPSHILWETQTLGTQTSDRTSVPVGTIQEAETRETKTKIPVTETRALTKITPSKFMAVITTPRETSATSDSPSGTGMTTVETLIGSDLSEAIFDTLSTDDSSEEAKRIPSDTWTLACTSTETRALALERNSVPPIITSQTLAPDITAIPKALVAYTITDIEITNCSVIEMETTAIIPRTSDIDHSPTGGKTSSNPETSVLPDFTEAEPHLTRTTTSSETLSTASVTESTRPDTTVETLLTANITTVGETTAAKATTPSGTLVTVSINPLEETSALSVETTSHTQVSGGVTISTGAGSTVSKATSPAGSSATVYNLSEVGTIKHFTPSETSATESTTSGPVPISRSPLSSVHLTVVNSSQETDITLAKTTASAKTPTAASMAGGKPPTAMPTTVRKRWPTEVTAGGEGGFLLLRLGVASPEDLTDPRVAERLMHQLHHELQAHMPPIQVSLLRVRRD
ncbi:mucin 20, cell surface associated [Rhinolophus ferrumequinum]|uniref:Mucin 20, cell surface associated n=1 Tax=Rhinolophus ferrumequinum TaxID=59479 RepID=A0A7J8AF55_RHIFE|nr:mucin 20, cell surface associated [Rhinolophus ferrumequinum]